ncbi:uncharacterized protein BDW70DRAFT_121754 [Aspergillus foveolatus]|uniref:uncharacterized protein n=1 Tax=Aspergillus foveolatus TaxID=210207 RepID=UPI003CCD805C
MVLRLAICRQQWGWLELLTHRVPCFRECLKQSIDLSTSGAGATVKDDGAKTRNRQSSVRPRRTETGDWSAVRVSQCAPYGIFTRDKRRLAGVYYHIPTAARRRPWRRRYWQKDKNVAGRIDPASDPCCNNHTHAEAYALESHFQPLNAIVPPVSETGRPTDPTISRPEVAPESRPESRPGMHRNNQTSRRRIQINQ